MGGSIGVGIWELITMVCEKHKLKKWGALERLKTFYQKQDKKKSIEKIVNNMSEAMS